MNLSLLSPHGQVQPGASTFHPLFLHAFQVPFPTFVISGNSSYQLHQPAAALPYSEVGLTGLDLELFHLIILSLFFFFHHLQQHLHFLPSLATTDPSFISISPTDTPKQTRPVNVNVNVNVTPRRENADRDDTPLRTKYIPYLLYLIIT